VAVVLIAGVSMPAALIPASGPAAAASSATLDHFECYTAAATTTRKLRASFTAKPHTLSLKNGFGSGGSTVKIDKVNRQCSPAEQTMHDAGHTVTTAITNGDARLVCWTITAAASQLPSLTLNNQFGTGTVQPTAAKSLCLPSWKNGTAPLKFPSTNAPANLDTYECYSAVHPAGTPAFQPPSSVKLKDQFGTATARVGAVNIVCVPTARRTNSHHSWTKVVDPTQDAVCFGVSTTSTGTRVAYDKSPFGIGAVKAAGDTELCVPSVDAAPPAATTTSPPTTSPPTSTTTPPTTTTPTPTWWTPTSAAPISWYWQLQGTIINQNVQVYDVDGFDTSAAEVAALHALGAKVICYINVGAAENWRSDYGSFPASVQGAAVGGFPGEYWLDISQLSVLEPIMTARMQMCAAKGFDAIEPDNVDGYTNTTGFALTAADQLIYNEWIATEAHSLGLSVGLKNDVGQTEQLEPYFDWALTEECNLDQECGTEYWFTQANKAVFNAEYIDDGESTAAFCPADATAHLNGALYDINLDGATYQPCTGTW